jgi:hypothetical protein
MSIANVHQPGKSFHRSDDADPGKVAARGRSWRFLVALDPGPITGAAGDDPSGPGTHSQVGAEIGRVTGAGIARNLRRHRPRPLLWSMASLLPVANIVNLPI